MMLFDQLFKPAFLRDFQSFASSLAVAINAEDVGVREVESENQISGMAVLSKFFVRSSSSASLSIYIFSSPEGTALELIPAGGACTYFGPIDYGIESDFANQTVRLLKERGWTVLAGTAPQNKIPDLRG